MPDTQDSLISMIRDLYQFENPDKAKRLKPEVYQDIISTYNGNYEDIVRGFYEQENPEKALRIDENVLKNIAQTYGFDMHGGMREQAIPQKDMVPPGISAPEQPTVTPGTEPEREVFWEETGFGRGLKTAGRGAVGSIGRAIEDASLKLTEIEKKISPFTLIGGEKYKKWLDDQGVRIADNIEQIQKWETDVPEMKGTFGEKLGALTPFAGMVVASALTRNPAVAKATIGLWGAMGYGEGIQAYDNYKKESGEPVDKVTRTGAGLLYSAVYSLPMGGYISKMMPKGLYNKAISKLLTSNNKTIEQTGRVIWENFLKQNPSLARKYALEMAKTGGRSVLTIEGIETGKMAVDNYLIGRDVSPQEFWQRTGEALETGILFGVITGPFAIYSQSAATTARRRKQGSVALGMNDKGQAFEIISQKGENIGLTPDGRIIKITQQDIKNSVKIPTEVFEKSITESRKINRSLYEGAEYDAVKGNLTDFARRAAFEMNGKATDAIHAFKDENGILNFVKRVDSKTGEADIITETGELRHIKKVPEKGLFETTVEKFVDEGLIRRFGPERETGAPPGKEPAPTPPEAPRTPLEQIKFYQELVRQRAENNVKSRLHKSGKFITVQDEDGNLLNVKDGDLSDPSGVIIVYDEAGEPKPIAINQVKNWETKEPDAVIQELMDNWNADMQKNVLQPQVGEIVTYQGKKYRITDDLGDFYVLFDGQNTPGEVPKQELIQQEIDNLLQLQVQAEQEKAGVPPEPAPGKPKEEVINTVRIGKTDFQYTVDDKGVFEFRIPEGMDPKRAEKEIKSTLPGEEGRIQLVTEEKEKPPVYPWQKPIIEKTIKAIRILPEAPKPVKIPEQQERKPEEVKPGEVKKEEKPEGVQKEELPEPEKPQLPELKREDFPYLSDFEFEKLTNPAITDEEKAPVVEKVNIVNKATETKHKSGVPVKEYIDDLYEQGYRLVGSEFVADNKPAIGLGKTNIEKNYALLKEALQPVPEGEEKIYIPKTPDEEREYGYRVEGGLIYHRKPAIQKIEKGSETNLEFTNKEKPAGNWVIVEADDLQPAHIGQRRNPHHFIGEAQPKERTDQVSEYTSEKIADKLDPGKITDKTTNAYFGAPTINTRGEVIQGNNRTSALKKYWDKFKDDPKEYRQYLIDNAEQLGLDPDNIARFKKPVLVNMLDIPDETAISLGQHTVNDLETGGKQTIDPVKAVRKLGDKLPRVIEILTTVDTQVHGDVSLREAIRINGQQALSYLYKNNIINDTQLQSAFKNDNLTGDAVDNLHDIVTYSLFAGKRADLNVYFEQLPHTMKMGIAKSIPEITMQDGLKEEVQDLIIAYKYWRNSPWGDIKNSVPAWSKNVDMLNPVPPEKEYGKVVVSLLDRLLKADTQKEIVNFFKEYKQLVKGGEGLQAAMYPAIGRAKAIEKLLNVPEDDQRRISEKLLPDQPRKGAERPGDELAPGQPPREGGRKPDQGGEERRGPEEKDREIEGRREIVKPDLPQKGEKYKVTKFYADTPVGTEGEVVKSWTDPEGNNWVKLYFGKNQSGQKLEKSFPLDVVEKTEAEKPVDLPETEDNLKKQIQDYISGGLKREIVVFNIDKNSVLGNFVTRDNFSLRQRVLTKAKSKHDIDLSSLYDLDKAISDPIFIFKSNNPQKPNAISILTQLRDQHGNNILTVVEADAVVQEGKDYYEINNIATIYGKENENVLRWIERDMLLYAHKNKGFEWLSATQSDSASVLVAQNLIEQSYNDFIENKNIPGEIKKPTEREIIKPEESQSERIQRMSAENDLQEIREKGSIRVADPEAVAKKIKQYTGVDVVADTDVGIIKLKPDDIVKEPGEDYLAGEILHKQDAVQIQIKWSEVLPAKRERDFGSNPETIKAQQERNYIPDIDNRLTNVERQLSDRGYLTFMGKKLTGPAKIKSANDIAFLFKNLESAVTEHAFAILIDKKGNYRVQYLSTGGTAGTIIDHKLIIAAAKEFNAAKVCFVHNHPSGALIASDADIKMCRHLRESATLMDIEYLPAIIIDIDKGKYAVINIDWKDTDIYEKKPVKGKIRPVRVYQFDRQKLYVNSEDKTRISSSHDAALFLSKQKRGTTNKTHVIILDRGNNINRYYLIDETVPVSDLIKQLFVDVGRYGESVILATNGSISANIASKIKNALKSISADVLDVLTIKQNDDIINNYQSLADQGMLHEPGKEIYEVHEDTPKGQLELKMFDIGEESAELAFDKKRMLQLLGSKMYEAPIAQVAVKELLQNSFDAVKASSARTGEEGRIDITINQDDRTIEIKDNGVGMTPDIVKNAFLTVGGTSKEGLGIGESSGGFGLAKVQFLLGSERIELETTRDGLTTTIDTTNLELYNGSFKLKKERTDKPNGTMVRVKIPESYTDFYGREKSVSFPGVWSALEEKWKAFSILEKPLLGNVAVKFKAISHGIEHEQLLPLGNNAKEKVPPLFTTAEFNWGEADLYMSEEKKEYPDHRILSAGIYQFDNDFTFRGVQRIPYDIIVNIKPHVAPTDEYYPFNNQREYFSPAVKKDMELLGDYIRKFASGEAEKEAANTFSDLRPLPKVDINKSLVEGARISLHEYAIRMRELNKEFNIEKETPKYKRILIRDEDVYIPSEKGYQKIDIEKEYETSFKARRKLEEETKVDVEFLNPDDPQMHNNTNVDFMSMEGAIEFFADLGAVLKDFVAKAGQFGGYRYEKIDDPNIKFFTGISIDKEYAGVHVQKILNAIFFNPLAKDFDNIEQAVHGTLHVFLHELAHEGTPGGHDESFAYELSELYVRMAEDISYYQPLLRILYQKHFETYRRLKHEYNKSSTKNLSRTLKERDEQRYSALRVGTHERPVRERQYSGEGRKRGGEVDKTGEGGDRTGEIIISKLNEGLLQEPGAEYGIPGKIMKQPLTEKEFNKKYEGQHIDIATKGESFETIKKEGWGSERSFALPIYKGGKPTNVVEALYGNRKGHFIYLVPKEWIRDTSGGMRIKKGWKPTEEDVVRIEYDWQSTYEAYRNKFEKLEEPKFKYGPPEKPKKEDYPVLSDFLKALEKYYKDDPDEYPPLKQKITKAQNAIIDDNGLIDETIMAHKTSMEVYSEKEKEKIPINETVDKMREFWIDENFPIRRWQEAVIERGGKLPKDVDAYRDIRNMFGRMEALYEEFQKENIEPIIKTFARIIKSGMKSKGILPYMISKHGLERNRVMREEEMEKFRKNNPDATMDELFDYEDKLDNKDFAGLRPFDPAGKYKNVDDLAQAIVDGFEKQVKPELIEELWKNTRKATDYTLDTWLEGGQISKKTCDYLKERYDYFIPLRGWREGAAKFLRYKNEGYGIGASLKKAFGRTSLADNPIAYIQAVGFKAINERVSNEIKQEALKIVYENYGGKFKDLHQIKRAYLVEKEIWNEDDQIYENVWTLYRDENGNLARPSAEMFKEGKVKTEINSEHEKLRTVWNARQHEVIVRNNGDFAVIVFPEKQLPVAQALNGQNTMVEFLGHVFDARKLGETWIFRGLGAWTNFMKAMMTSYNPVFPFSNFSRDQLEASLTQNIRLNTRMTKVPENIPVAVRAIIRNMSGKYDPDNKYDVELRNCREAGGMTGFTHEKTIKQLEKELNNELKHALRSDTLRGKTTDKLVHLFRYIEYWNRIFEDTTRFGVYLDARDKGMSIKDSAFESRNSSVDFNMKGKGIRAIEALYAFFKVSMSALQKNFQLAKINPAKFIRNAVSVLVWGFLEAALNDWKDEEDETSKYDRINNYVRENYLVVRQFWGEEEKYLRIPLSQFWRGFHAMGVTTYDYINGKISEGTAIGRIISNFIAGMAPIDVTAFLQEGKFSWAPIVPTVVKPVWEVNVNRDFMDNKIAYTAFTKELEEDLANAGLHKKNVNPAAKFITDVLFHAGGGKAEYKFRYGKDGRLKYVPGIMDWNPSQLEHLISGYLGGAGRFTNDFTTTLFQFVNPEEEIDIDNVPFVNFFVRNIPDEKWAVLDKYYRYKEHIENAGLIARKAEREGDIEELQKYISGDYPKAIEILSSYESSLNALKETYGEDIEGLQGIEELSNLMIDLRKEAVEQWNQLKINKP